MSYKGLLSKELIPVTAIRDYYVYALWDESGIVYIGKTVRLLSRIEQHQTTKHFTHFSYFKAKNEEEMDLLEKKLIFEIQPKYNVRIDSHYTLQQIRERIRTKSEYHKYSKEFYVRNIRKKLIENGVKIETFKGKECVNIGLMPEVFRILLDEKKEVN